MVSVSIVVHNTPQRQLKQCLDCLLRDDVNRIYIIENSLDANFQDFCNIDSRIFYRHEKNQGYGAGHNIAIREVIKEFPDGYHLVMNADVWWQGLVINKLKNYLDENNEVGMVMPKIYYPDGALQLTCRMLPSPLDLIGKRFLPSILIRKRVDRFLLVEHNHDKALNSPYLLGSFLLFRNKALIEKGIFDERFFMYPEDIDITRRIHESWKTMYWPEVSVIHEHQAASRKNLKMLWIHISNMVKYFNKWGWMNDKKRKEYNSILLKSIDFQPVEERPASRG